MTSLSQRRSVPRTVCFDLDGGSLTSCSFYTSHAFIGFYSSCLLANMTLLKLTQTMFHQSAHSGVPGVWRPSAPLPVLSVNGSPGGIFSSCDLVENMGVSVISMKESSCFSAYSVCIQCSTGTARTYTRGLHCMSFAYNCVYLYISATLENGHIQMCVPLGKFSLVSCIFSLRKSA